MKIEYDIRTRLIRIEKHLVSGFRRLHSESVSAPPTEHDRVLSQWSARIRADKVLGYPHRKILDVLLGEYDPGKEAFRPICFSKLVQAARVGKNMAKGYLTLLEARGYIDRRSDGYRVFYALRQQ